LRAQQARAIVVTETGDLEQAGLLDLDEEDRALVLLAGDGRAEGDLVDRVADALRFGVDLEPDLRL
jgi:Na+-transporting NADH:ubiquinone oxidoreductase subunit NqrA